MKSHELILHRSETLRGALGGLIAGFRAAARVVLAHWRAGLDHALRYLGGVRE
jgi:hypothetical protein